MKVAVLEDSEFRLEYWDKHYPGYYLFTHVDDLLAALKEEKFDLIFLDHDLDGNAFVDETEYNCGTTAAVMMQDIDLGDAKIIIHSMNFPAAERMQQILRKFKPVRIPFGWLPKDGNFIEFWK